jgi:hypothetical protein
MLTYLTAAVSTVARLTQSQNHQDTDSPVSGQKERSLFVIEWDGVTPVGSQSKDWRTGAGRLEGF